MAFTNAMAVSSSTRSGNIGPENPRRASVHRVLRVLQLPVELFRPSGSTGRFTLEPVGAPGKQRTEGQQAYTGNGEHVSERIVCCAEDRGEPQHREDTVEDQHRSSDETQPDTGPVRLSDQPVPSPPPWTTRLDLPHSGPRRLLHRSSSPSWLDYTIPPYGNSSLCSPPRLRPPLTRNCPRHDKSPALCGVGLPLSTFILTPPPLCCQIVAGSLRKYAPRPGHRRPSQTPRTTRACRRCRPGPTT